MYRPGAEHRSSSGFSLFFVREIFVDDLEVVQEVEKRLTFKRRRGRAKVWLDTSTATLNKSDQVSTFSDSCIPPHVYVISRRLPCFCNKLSVNASQPLRRAVPLVSSL